jgi:uncharacterized membrane protein
MRRVAILCVCSVALLIAGVMAADEAEARRSGGRGLLGGRAGSTVPRYPTYFTPQNPYGESYYNPKYYGGYYGRGFYMSPGGPMHIGW